MKQDLRIIFGTICILAFLTACTSTNNTKSQPQVTTQLQVEQIFVETITTTGLGPTGIDKRIWRIEKSKTQPELLFELENLSDKPLNKAFSTQELAAFEDWHSSEEGEEHPQATEIFPFIGSRQITLSPIGQRLAWIEFIFWRPSESTLQFTTLNLMMLDFISGETKKLYETSQHLSGIYSLERNSLDGLAWSPDGQKIVFVEGVQGEHQAKIVDVVTGSVENLGEPGEGGIFSSWSPDGTSIVMSSPDTLNILSITGSPPQKDITGSWGVIDGLDWSPDGKTIIFAASKDSFPERLKLYVINVDEKDLDELPLDENLNYEAPKWSPDSQLIAMNVSSTRLEEIDKLLVYHVETQAIVATLEGKRSSQNFYWSDDGRTILLTMGVPPDMPRAIELFYWQENRTEVIPFPEGIDDGVAIGISSN
jgi:WD40 repeat protein